MQLGEDSVEHDGNNTTNLQIVENTGRVPISRNAELK